MSGYWSPTVQRLTPYVPGEQRTGGNIVKLNTNENPYPPAPSVLAAIASVNGEQLRRYPAPESDALRSAIARHHKVSVEQVFVGNGSDEILALSFLAFFSGRDALQFPTPSYSFYPVYCGLYGIVSQPLVLDQNFNLDLARFAVSRSDSAGGIIFPNPNAPSGLAVSRADIATLLERHAGVVLVDEAYADFGAESAIPLAAEHPNLIISRTFSKGRSLAGMRLGYAVASEELMDGLRRVKNSFNSYPVDAVAEAAGIASLEDDHAYRGSLSRILSTRTAFTESLRKRGFEVLESAANFVFARPPSVAATALAQSLANAGVLVRHWQQPAIEQWLRISIGTDEDMQRLLTAVDTYLDDAAGATGD
jgi:histidinol-phosphate aminotransferase